MSAGLTRYQQLPYPVSGRVRGNGAADDEALATKADAQLDRIGAAWTVARTPDSAIYVLGSTFTGVLANNTYSNAFNLGLGQRWGTHPPLDTSGPGQGAFSEQWGWYAVSVCISSIPSGTVNTGSRRVAIANVYDASGSATPAAQFIKEDYETGSGECVLSLDFVAYFGQLFRLSVDFAHGNTSSTLNITTTSTFTAFNRIMGTG